MLAESEDETNNSDSDEVKDIFKKRKTVFFLIRQAKKRLEKNVILL